MALRVRAAHTLPDAASRRLRPALPVTAVLADAGGLAAVVARAVAFAGIAGTIGACAFHFFVVRTRGGATPIGGSAVAEATTRFGAAAATLAGLAITARIVTEAFAFAEPGDSLASTIGAVLDTQWGNAATIEFCGAAAALAGFAAARTFGRWGWGTAIAACGVLATAPAFMGHAAASASWPATAIATDAVHVAAGGAWAGALGALAWTVRSLGANDDEVGATLIARFAPLALTGASALLVTGVISAAIHLRTLGDLIGTRYGGLLVIKVGVVLGVAMLGRRHMRTAAGEVRGGRRVAVARSIGGEVLLMLAVFAVTALLAGSPTPGE